MIQSKWALVTGASSGIGLELARLFARDGYSLVLVARNREAMQTLADELRRRYGTTSIIIQKDLSLPSAPLEIFQQLQQETIRVDVLVNNAGFGSFGLFTESDLKSQLEMLQVNITALTHLTRLFLPEMIRRREGKILNVASTAAFQPGPLMAVYYASKVYVLSFSEALASEVRGTGVTISTLCPGPTPTGFQKRAGMEQSGLLRFARTDAATVARAGYKGLMRGKTIIIPGLLNKFGVLAERFTPRKLLTESVKAIQKERLKQKP